MSVNNTYLLNPVRQVIAEPFKALSCQNDSRTFFKPCGCCRASQSARVNSQYGTSPIFSELNKVSHVRYIAHGNRLNGSCLILPYSLSDKLKVAFKAGEIDWKYKWRLLSCAGEVWKGSNLLLSAGSRRISLPTSSSANVFASLRKEIVVDWTGKHVFCPTCRQSSNLSVRGGGLNVVAKVGQSESSLQEAALDDEEEQLNMRIRALMGSLEASVGTSTSETDEEEGEDDVSGKNIRRRSWQERGEWDEGWGWGDTQRERRKGRKKGSSGRLNTMLDETDTSDKAVYGTQADIDVLGGSTVWRRSGTPGESWQDVSMGMELIWRKLPVVEVKDDTVGEPLVKQSAGSENLTGQKGDRYEEQTREDLGTSVNRASQSQLLNTRKEPEKVVDDVRQGSNGATLDSASENFGLGGVRSGSRSRASVISDAASEFENVSTVNEGGEMDDASGGLKQSLEKDSAIDSKVGKESRLRIEGSLLSEPPGQVATNDTRETDLRNDVSSVREVGSENLNVDKDLKELVTDNGVVDIKNRNSSLEAMSSGITAPVANDKKSEVTAVFDGSLVSEYDSVAPLEGVVQLGISSSEANQPPSILSTSGRPAGAATAGVPIVAGLDQSYQRLTINNDLALYSARKLARRGRVKEAEAKLRQCIRVWPGDGRAYVTLGKVMQNQGLMKEARKVYEEGCQAVGGDNAFLWQAWAVLEERLGNKTRARTLFDAATAADKRHVAGWHGWAMLELREGNEMKARKLLKKGLQLCGASEYFYQTLAILESKAGRLAEARVLFRKATAANQWSVPSWLAWAKMEVEQGEVVVARRLFQRALESSPKNRYTYQAWALFEAEQGKEALARKLLQMGRRLNPKDTGLLLAGALIEYESGFTGAARDLFREGTLLDPKFGSMWRAWGWMEWREGKLDAARELYEKAAVVEPNSPRVYQAMGVLEEGAGNTALARKLFKRALKLDPSNVPTWYSWAAMEERLGNSVRAEELRNLCQQQSTEVVDNSWEFSDILGPAIDRVRSFFNFEREPRSSVSGKEEISPEVFADEEEDSVDIEKFLAEKIEPKLKPTKTVHSIWKRRVPPEEVQRVREKSKRYNRFLRQRDSNQAWAGENDKESVTMKNDRDLDYEG